MVRLSKQPRRVPRKGHERQRGSVTLRKRGRVQNLNQTLMRHLLDLLEGGSRSHLSIMIFRRVCVWRDALMRCAGEVVGLWVDPRPQQRRKSKLISWLSPLTRAGTGTPKRGTPRYAGVPAYRERREGCGVTVTVCVPS